LEYSFNVDIAQMYGVEESIFIHNLYFWILKNEANGRHWYEGRHWTYNSMAAFSELFPFWTTSQMRRIISNCVAKGAVIKGNFNKSNYDRTTWYALSETVTSIYANRHFDLLESTNGIVQTNSPIPDNKPDNKPYSKPDRGAKRFCPPTYDEVKAYCLERKNNVDPEKFIDFYQSKGWMVGKSKMKDWKASVRTWEKRESKKETDLQRRKRILEEQIREAEHGDDGGSEEISESDYKLLPGG
jgi:hypothetical protein